MMSRQGNTPYHHPTISIVITDFNGWTQTKECLGALQNSVFQDFEIILVDHGTSEETREGVQREAPDTILLRGSPDHWWAGSTNLGIRTALGGDAPYIMLLNNDCFVKPGTIGTLVKHANQSPSSIIAPVQRDNTTGEYIAITPRDLLLLGFIMWSGGPREITRVMRERELLPSRLIGGGRGVLIPRGVFTDVGLLDDKNLPHYYADHDFYMRCRAAGIPLLVAVDAEVDIDGSRTSSAKQVGCLTWKEFLSTLTDIRSHRNIAHLRELFKKHYPIRFLYFIGLWLSNLRYFSVYAIKRLKYLLSSHN